MSVNPKEILRSKSPPDTFARAFHARAREGRDDLLRLALWTLRHIGDGQPIELYFAVGSFFDKKHLPTAAGHLRRLGRKPA
jgi:hypothetical protein